jgi:hypothetical protein
VYSRYLSSYRMYFLLAHHTRHAVYRSTIYAGQSPKHTSEYPSPIYQHIAYTNVESRDKIPEAPGHVSSVCIFSAPRASKDSVKGNPRDKTER